MVWPPSYTASITRHIFDPQATLEVSESRRLLLTTAAQYAGIRCYSVRATSTPIVVNIDLALTLTSFTHPLGKSYFGPTSVMKMPAVPTIPLKANLNLDPEA